VPGATAGEHFLLCNACCNACSSPVCCSVLQCVAAATHCLQAPRQAARAPSPATPAAIPPIAQCVAVRCRVLHLLSQTPRQRWPCPLQRLLQHLQQPSVLQCGAECCNCSAKRHGSAGLLFGNACCNASRISRVNGSLEALHQGLGTDKQELGMVLEHV